MHKSNNIINKTKHFVQTNCIHVTPTKLKKLKAAFKKQEFTILDVGLVIIQPH